MPSALLLSPSEQAQVTAGSSAVVSWAEQPALGTTVTGRLVSLLMAIPRNGSCAVDRWVTATGWQSTGSSPQTVSGLRTGYCYRAVVALTDSTGTTTRWQSGTMLVDPAAPVAAFASPAPSVVTSLAGSTASIVWTETMAPGTHIVSRVLYVEHAFQAAASSCMGAQWGVMTSTTSASPFGSSGLVAGACYRYRLVLKDSAGHVSTTVSSVLMGPAA
jgi:hypothetical protein